jgi:hypothetical protein
MPRWWTPVATVVVISALAGCGDRGEPTASSSSVATTTSTLASTTLTTTTVSTTSLGKTTSLNATSGRCRGSVLAQSPQSSLAGDFDGDGAVDEAHTYRTSAKAGEYTFFVGVLQMRFGDGGLSQFMDVESTDLLAAIDLDGDAGDELLVALSSNTAVAGGVVTLRDCSPRYVADDPRAGTRPLVDRFSYVFGATGGGCAPACYPSVECRALIRGHELVVHGAERADVSVLPSLGDELLYNWRIDRWRFVDGIMVNAEHRDGQATHRALPVPKRQGFYCN